jgi:hypothetical protein
MSGPPGSRSSATTLLLVTAVLLIVGVVVVTVLPLVPCADCQRRNLHQDINWYTEDALGHNGKSVDPTVIPPRPAPTYCEDCRPNGKLTLLQRWLRRLRQ